MNFFLNYTDPDAKDIHVVTFRRLWRSLFPKIIIAKPRTDLCRTCQVQTTILVRGVHLSDVKKLEHYQKAKNHLDLATEQRDCYNQQLKAAKLSTRGKRLGPSEPLGHEGKMHYAFDFAQQMHFPSDPMQAGPIYFLTPRKCLLFGMCCTGIPQQVGISNAILKAHNLIFIRLLLSFILTLAYAHITLVHLVCLCCAFAVHYRFAL